jgi:hypothetical protein
MCCCAFHSVQVCCGHPLCAAGVLLGRQLLAQHSQTDSAPGAVAQLQLHQSTAMLPAACSAL